MVSQLTQRKLIGLRTKIRVLFAAFGLSVFVSMLAGSILVAFGLDYLLRGPWPFRLGVNVIAVAFLVYCLYRFLLYPLSVKMNVDDMALCVERGFPGLKDRLISSLQLARRFDPEDTFSSSAMVRSLMAETEQITGKMRFGAVVGLHGRMAMFVIMGIIGLVVLVGGTNAFPNTAKIFWNRVVLLAEEDTYPRDWTFKIDNHEKTQYIPSGEKVRIEISVMSTKEGSSKQYEGEKPRIGLVYEGEKDRVKEKDLNEVADKPGKYYVEIDKVTENITVTIKGPAGIAERNFYPIESRINVVDRPDIKTIRHMVFLPKCDRVDANDEPEVQSGGKIVAYRGSRVTMQIHTKREIKDTSYIQFANIGKDRKPLGKIVLQRPDANNIHAGDYTYWIASFVIEKSCAYNFVLFDRQFNDEKFQNANPQNYEVAVLDDRNPKMKFRSLTQPRVKDGLLPIRIVAEDDKYVDRVRLFFRHQVAGGEARQYAAYDLYSSDIQRWIRKVRNIKQESIVRYYEKECDIAYDFDYRRVVETLQLELGDTIYFRAIVSDGFDLRDAHDDNSVDAGKMSGAKAALMKLSTAMVVAEIKANDYTARKLLLRWIYQSTAEGNPLAKNYEIAALESMLKDGKKKAAPEDSKETLDTDAPTLLDGLELSEEIRLKMRFIMMDSMFEQLPEEAITLMQRVITRRLLEIRRAECERDYDVCVTYFEGGLPDNASLLETQKSEAKAKIAVYEQFLVIEDGDIIDSLMKYIGETQNAAGKKIYFEQQIARVRDLVSAYVLINDEDARKGLFDQLDALAYDTPELPKKVKVILDEIVAYKAEASEEAIKIMKNKIDKNLIDSEIDKEMSEIRTLIKNVEFSFDEAQNFGKSLDNDKLKRLYEETQRVRATMWQCIEEGNPHFIKEIQDADPDTKLYETEGELKVRYDRYMSARDDHYAEVKKFLAEERFGSAQTYSNLVLIYNKLILKGETLRHLGSMCAKGEAEILKHCKRIDELYYARKTLAEETISANWLAVRASSEEVTLYTKQLEDKVGAEKPIAENYGEYLGNLEAQKRSLEQAIKDFGKPQPAGSEEAASPSETPEEGKSTLTLDDLEKQLLECNEKLKPLKNIRERVESNQIILQIVKDEVQVWIGPHVIYSDDMQIDIVPPSELKDLLLGRANALNKELGDTRKLLRENIDTPISNYVALLAARDAGGREMVDAYKNLYKDQASAIESDFINKGEKVIVEAIEKQARKELDLARNNYKVFLASIRTKIMPLAQGIYEDSKYNNLRDENADPENNLQDILFLEDGGAADIDKTIISVLREIDIVYGARIQTELRNIDQRRGSEYRKMTEQHISSVRTKLNFVGDRLGNALGELALQSDLQEIKDRLRKVIIILDPEAAEDLTKEQEETINLAITRAGALGLDTQAFIFELLAHPDLDGLEITERYEKLDELCDAIEYAINEREAEKLEMESEINMLFAANLSWEDIIKKVRLLGKDPEPKTPENAEGAKTDPKPEKSAEVAPAKSE